MTSIVALSGGVGGAKLALGLSRCLSPDALMLVANTGDDFEHLGLTICPDLDTLMYTLAGLSDPERGWGLADESWQCLGELARLGGPAWFRLGDRDLATHLMRTAGLRDGRSLSAVTTDLCAALGVRHPLRPMSDQAVRTVVHTTDGDLSFQEYFVRRQCAPAVTGFHFAGVGVARAQPDWLAALQAPALSAVVLCPSNPFVSIGPMLALPGVREALAATAAPVVAVSPIVGGTALKGPAAKMMAELGWPTTVTALAEHYAGLVNVLVIDEQDAAQAAAVEQHGMTAWVMPTVMQSLTDKTRLAETLLSRLAGERA